MSEAHHRQFEAKIAVGMKYPVSQTIKIDKAEEQIRGLTSEESLKRLLTQDDALRLAKKETAVRSREVGKQDMQELYEKVVLDEISIPEYFYFITNSVKGRAHSSALKEIRNNFGRFV